jgi:hypothetical protein
VYILFNAYNAHVGELSTKLSVVSDAETEA